MYFCFLLITHLHSDWFVRRFGVHILVFTVASIGCAVVAFHFLGLVYRAFSDREGKTNIISHIVPLLPKIFFVFAAFVGGVVGCVWAVISLRQALYPFAQDLNDPLREKLLLEF